MQHAQFLCRCRFLLLHPDPVMGGTLASALEHHGGRIAGVHRTAELSLQALSFHGLAHHRDLVAVLDARLDDSARVAQALADRGVPYLLLAGPEDLDQSDSRAAALVTAPVSRRELLDAIGSLCRTVTAP